MSLNVKQWGFKVDEKRRGNSYVHDQALFEATCKWLEQCEIDALQEPEFEIGGEG